MNCNFTVSAPLHLFTTTRGQDDRSLVVTLCEQGLKFFSNLSTDSVVTDFLKFSTVHLKNGTISIKNFGTVHLKFVEKIRIGRIRLFSTC
jgi:hypothetical protein